MTARRCDACRTMIPEGTPALVPALKGTGVRTWVWSCPSCGCENYDAPPAQEEAPAVPPTPSPAAPPTPSPAAPSTPSPAVPSTPSPAAPPTPSPAAPPTPTPQRFPLGAIVSVVTGIGCCELDQLVGLIDFLAGREVPDYARGDVAMCESAPLAQQFPALAAVEVPADVAAGGMPTIQPWLFDLAASTGLGQYPYVVPLGLDFRVALSVARIRELGR